MNKRIVTIMLSLSTFSLFSCKSSSIDDKFEKNVNIDKPIVFYNTPLLKSKTLNSKYTLEYDDDKLSFNNRTVYVGLDYETLAKQQADMIYNYIEENKSTINRTSSSSGNVDEANTLKYILVTDDNDSYFSQLKIKAIRERLGTIPSEESDIVKCGDDVLIETLGKLSFTEDEEVTEFKVQEYKSLEMKSVTGKNVEYITRDLNDTIKKENSEGDNLLDLIITISDDYSVAIYNTWSKSEKIPTFGFGGSASALKLMSDNQTTAPYAGTVYINNSYLAYTRMRVLKNLIDNREDFYEYGIIDTSPDENGSYLKDAKKYISYSDDHKKILFKGLIINKTNASEYKDYDEMKNFDDTLVTTKDSSHKIWYSRVLTGNDTLDDYEYAYEQKYFSLLNLNSQINDDNRNTDATIQSEKYFLNQFINLNDYEGYLINLYNPLNSSEYINALKQ